jgi:hypothetical protein
MLWQNMRLLSKMLEKTFAATMTHHVMVTANVMSTDSSNLTLLFEKICREFVESGQIRSKVSRETPQYLVVFFEFVFIL